MTEEEMLAELDKELPKAQAELAMENGLEEISSKSYPNYLTGNSSRLESSSYLNPALKGKIDDTNKLSTVAKKFKNGKGIIEQTVEGTLPEGTRKQMVSKVAAGLQPTTADKAWMAMEVGDDLLGWTALGKIVKAIGAGKLGLSALKNKKVRALSNLVGLDEEALLKKFKKAENLRTGAEAGLLGAGIISSGSPLYYLFDSGKMDDNTLKDRIDNLSRITYSDLHKDDIDIPEVKNFLEVYRLLDNDPKNDNFYKSLKEASKLDDDKFIDWLLSEDTQTKIGLINNKNKMLEKYLNDIGDK